MFAEDTDQTQVAVTNRYSNHTTNSERNLIQVQQQKQQQQKLSMFCLCCFCLKNVGAVRSLVVFVFRAPKLFSPFNLLPKSALCLLPLQLLIANQATLILGQSREPILLLLLAVYAAAAADGAALTERGSLKWTFGCVVNRLLLKRKLVSSFAVVVVVARLE